MIPNIKDFTSGRFKIPDTRTKWEKLRDRALPTILVLCIVGMLVGVGLLIGAAFRP